MPDFLLMVLVLLLFFFLYLIWLFSQESNQEVLTNNSVDTNQPSVAAKPIDSKQDDKKIFTKKLHDHRFDDCSKIPSKKYKCLTCNQPCHLSNPKRPINK